MSRRRRPPIAFAYHGVGDVPLREDPYGLFTPPCELEWHIRALRRWGYRLVSFGELAARAGSGEADGCASLTFDDGLADNLERLLPILRRESATATVFVVSGWLGQPYPHAPRTRVLTADEVKSLHAAGIEIGGHSATHPDLTSLPYDDALRELVRCRKELEGVIDSPVRVAAYPFGRAADETVRACRAAGYAAACLTGGRGSWDEPLLLPRHAMGNGSTRLGFRLKRRGLYKPLMRLKAARVGRSAVRAVRRAKS